MPITPGLSHTAAVTVDEHNIASALGSGLVDVFATPMMVALLEQAASECIRPCLEAGQASVGTHLDVSHTAATPVGLKVFATATVREVDRRRVVFDISVRDEVEEIGRGTHTRFIIELERFMQKAAQKSAQPEQ